MRNSHSSISISNLELGYSHENPLLPKFSVDAKLGELIALIGRNGIGKSTLLRSIIGLQLPLSGAILIQGKQVKTLHRKQRAKTLSFVPAEPVRISNLYIRDFVAIGRFPHLGWSRSLSASDWALVDHALSLVGVSHLAKRDITTVSDGERQRAMIAFALAQDTKIIILDEPTAFLDLPNKFEMVRLLSHLAHEKDKTIIYSTHDLQGAIHEADTIWMMLKTGFASGAPEELALTNMFQELLADTQVVFETSTGLFRNYRSLNKSIALEGQGSVFIWTTRLLERIGFEVNTLTSSDLKVICTQHDHDFQWIVKKNGNQIYSTKTMTELASYLSWQP
jgi:iron complex transport system ATP-binding protein